jgi:hypothetical protein
MTRIPREYYDVVLLRRDAPSAADAAPLRETNVNGTRDLFIGGWMHIRVRGLPAGCAARPALGWMAPFRSRGEVRCGDVPQRAVIDRMPTGGPDTSQRVACPVSAVSILPCALRPLAAASRGHRDLSRRAVIVRRGDVCGVCALGNRAGRSEEEELWLDRVGVRWALGAPRRDRRDACRYPET